MFLFFSTNLLAKVSGKINYETSAYSNNINANEAIDSISAHDKSLFKNQLELKFYINDEIENIGNTASYHLELNLNHDQKGISDYRSTSNYTQKDILREAYIDVEYDDWSARLGKQQVVWGTADGIKLLDFINPTDFSELSQNSNEDARIPIWMINAEKEMIDGSNIQIIISQARENIFAGLNRVINTSVRQNSTSPNAQGSFSDLTQGGGHNIGHPFILKGIDTLTGQRNGFLNIAPDLGSLAADFGLALSPLFSTSTGGLNQILANYLTVGDFAVNTQDPNAIFGTLLGRPATLAELNQNSVNLQTGVQIAQGVLAASVTTIGFADLNFGLSIALRACVAGFNQILTSPCANLFVPASITQPDIATVFNAASSSFTGQAVLDDLGTSFNTNISSFSDNQQNSTADYATGASFRTFDTFINARSQYIFNLPNDSDTNIAFRFKKRLSNGFNYSLNYSYNYHHNPVIDLSWRNTSGEVLTRQIVSASTVIAIPGATTLLTGQHIELTDSQGRQYGGSFATTSFDAIAVLTFEQTLERVHNIGGSFDYLINTKALGSVVLRGEALYQKDVHSIIINRGGLNIGDIADAFIMMPGNKFKYVLGADVTAFTNLLISAQFIQERNLDYIDNDIDFDGTPCINVNCGIYTADFANLHLTNGLLKDQKNKELYSVYLSKPFGGAKQHRWNNLTIFEDQGSGAFWNRFDVVYSLTDDFSFTAQWNRYWGEENSRLGQFNQSSNIQGGFKYIF